MSRGTPKVPKSQVHEAIGWVQRGKKLSLCRSEVKGNQKWTPLFCKEMHPGHKPGRFAEVGPESWPPMATKSAVLFFWHAFFTGLRNLYKLQLCTKSDYITVIYVAASFWCTFFYHFFNDTHRYSKNIDWQGTVVRVQIVHRIRIFTSCNLSSEVRRNGVRWIEMEDASSRTHDTRDSLPSWRLAELLIESRDR